jgi:hypothetical protein
MVLIYISFMARDIEHFFFFFLFLVILALKNSVQFICPFLNWVIDFFGSLVF